MSERIVILGHSVVTCLGSDMESTWTGLIAGKSGLRRQPSLGRGKHLQDIAGMVEDFGPGTPNADPAVAAPWKSAQSTWPLPLRRGAALGRRSTGRRPT